MAAAFEMPKLGLTMEFGTILQWLVADGDQVAVGQPILLIETDKVETEVESSGAGVFHAVAVVGETYDCGAHLGWFLEAGEAPPAAPASAGAATAAASTPTAPAAAVGAVSTGSAAATVTASTDAHGRIMASPNAKRVAAERGVDLATVVGTGPGGRIVSEDVEAAPVSAIAGGGAAAAATAAAVGAAARSASAGGPPRPATAAARQLADLLGVDLAEVPATPPDPRITRDDVARYVRQRLAEAAGPTAASGSSSTAAARLPAMPLLQTPAKTVPLTGMRGTIAQRMHGSLQGMAQLTLMMDVDMGAVAADRAARKESGKAPGFTDYVIAATAKALKDHPYANSQVTDDGVSYLPEINVGMAVAIDNGLMVPVVKNTDALSLDDLSAETTRLADAARSGGLKLPDLEGGTFSVTALGMFGVDGFTPVINPPNSAILGIGRLRDDVAWADDGTPQRATKLTLSLTWDHRAFDGAPAAEFVRTICNNLEAV